MSKLEYFIDPISYSTEPTENILAQINLLCEELNQRENVNYLIKAKRLDLKLMTKKKIKEMSVPQYIIDMIEEDDMKRFVYDNIEDIDTNNSDYKYIYYFDYLEKYVTFTVILQYVKFCDQIKEIEYKSNFGVIFKDRPHKIKIFTTKTSNIKDFDEFKSIIILFERLNKIKIKVFENTYHDRYEIVIEGKFAENMKHRNEFIKNFIIFVKEKASDKNLHTHITTEYSGCPTNNKDSSLRFNERCDTNKMNIIYGNDRIVKLPTGNYAEHIKIAIESILDELNHKKNPINSITNNTIRVSNERIKITKVDPFIEFVKYIKYSDITDDELSWYQELEYVEREIIFDVYKNFIKNRVINFPNEVYNRTLIPKDNGTGPFWNIMKQCICVNDEVQYKNKKRTTCLRKQNDIVIINTEPIPTIEPIPIEIIPTLNTYIYVLTSEDRFTKNVYKIGKHTGSYKNLIKRYQTPLITPIVIYFNQCENFSQIEKDILLKVNNFRIKNKDRKTEWVKMDLYVLINYVNEIIY